jgi:hypothetical protein
MIRPMRIDAIAHASLLFRHAGSAILVDPWFKGDVFLGGWRLDPPPLREVIDALPRIDFIYVTHEHPDHLHIPTLKELFLGPAREAVLLVPRLMTDRFARRLRSAFPDRRIRELEHGRRYRLGPFEAWSYQFRIDDSTFVLRAGGYCAVNANDTFVKGLALSQITRAHGRPDVLFSSFSVSNAFPYCYADYALDPGQFPWQQADLTDYCVRLIGAVQPRIWVPHASFFRFCRGDNAYLNPFRESIAGIERALAGRTGATEIRPLFPGDSLESGRYVPHPRGRSHFEDGRSASLVPVREVSSVFRRRAGPCGFELRPSGEHLVFDPATARFARGGRELKAAHLELPWTATSRSAFARALRHPWGIADLMICGCIRVEVPPDRRARAFVFWALGLLRHTGYLDLGSGWFLEARGLSVAARRWREALDIARSALAGGLLAGNLEPRRVGQGK